MLAASRRLAIAGGVMVAIGFLFLILGIVLAMYGVFAIAVHDTDGTAQDIEAIILVFVLSFAPLAVALVLLGIGGFCLLRASRLRELRSLVYGRESVTTSEIAARTRRSEIQARALLLRAQKHDAAWPIA
jgi:hypothetical protein